MLRHAAAGRGSARALARETAAPVPRCTAVASAAAAAHLHTAALPSARRTACSGPPCRAALAASSSASPSLSLHRQFATTATARKTKADQRLIEKHGFNPYGYKVAVFGRPNVGKSTLFNRLVGKHMAIVDKRPGVTRDRRDADASIGDLEFRLIDTAGLEEIQKFLMKDKHEYQLINNEPMNAALQKSIIEQTESAIAECDVALFVIDGREGVTSLDHYFSKWLRRQCRTTTRHVDANGVVTHVTRSKPVVLLANKCDNFEHESKYFGLVEGYELGFGEPVPISADHSAGMSGLHNALYEAFLTVHEAKAAAFPAREKMINADIANIANLHEIKLAIVGKVNVGKSTLINTLLGQTRVLTGSQPGVTRDPIEIEWRDEKEEKREMKRRIEERKLKEEELALQKSGFDSTPKLALPASTDSTTTTTAVPLPSYRFTLVDTAGLKGVTHHAHSKFGRVDEQSMAQSLRSIERANVVALVVDISDAGMDGVQKDTDGKATQVISKRKAARLAKLPQPLSPTQHLSPAAAAAAATAVAPVPLSPSLLFKPDKKYTEEERGFLLRTFVRNVFSAADLAIAAKILNEGRALMILLNKFDLVPTPELREQILEGVAKELDGLLSLAGSGVTVLGVSGARQYDSLRGQTLKTTIRSSAMRCFEQWSARVSTHRLNQWLIEILKFHPPPSAPGIGSGGPPRRIALKFIQQVATRPPTFVVFANRPGDDLPDEYKRFLINALRKEFDLGGVAVRLFVRARKNPYSDPNSRLAARAAKGRAAADATLPAFAEEAAEEDDAEFDEADYSPLDKEIKFDYDADATDVTVTTEGQEEIRRERQVRGGTSAAAPAAGKSAAAPASSKKASAAAPIVDTPIPRAAAARRQPRVNTSSIFASTRTISKPRRTTQPAFRWSIQTPRTGGGAAKAAAGVRSGANANSWTPAAPVHKKPFGTKRPKLNKVSKADKNLQSPRVAKTLAKVDKQMAARKEATASRKLAAKAKRATAKKSRGK